MYNYIVPTEYISVYIVCTIQINSSFFAAVKNVNYYNEYKEYVITHKQHMWIDIQLIDILMRAYRRIINISRYYFITITKFGRQLKSVKSWKVKEKNCCQFLHWKVIITIKH